jgi:ferric-dicitrate binding protein FerR (iron transport regulator)
MKEIPKEIFIRFFKNKYSRNDYLEIRKFALKKENKLLLENIMAAYWEDFKLDNNTKEKDFSSMLSRMNEVINESNSNPFLKKAINFYIKIAAVVLFPILTALGVLYFQFNTYLTQKEVFVEVHSPAGTRTSLNLPDGSLVWLNSGATIKYPAVFNEHREVEMEGEVYFEVESNKKYPFMVATKDINIKATGTKFNIASYNDDSFTRVLLQEGKVEVLDKKDFVVKQMNAGFQLTFNKENSNIDYQKINAKKYTRWTEGILIFENSSMKDVVNRLKRWYNVDIEVEDEELLQLHFKATFIDEGFEEALKLLQQTSTFNYKFEKRLKKPDGSYNKIKVFINKNSSGK